MSSSASAQAYVTDPRNESVHVYVNGEFVPRSEAKVSIFDAGFGLGDGVWEGLRLVNGRLICLDEHLDRLYEGANAIRIDIGLTRDAMQRLLFEALERNAMKDGAHIRLMVTRGTKSTVNQDPRFTLGGATIVIVAEYKQPNPAAKERGLSLFTSTFRCSSPDVFDLRLNSHSRLNLIQALIQAIDAGADEALMLDPHGFVASCNSTNFFVVRKGELWTSTGRFNFKGITRGKIVAAARERGMPVFEKDFTLAETWSADEAFVTGTLGGVTPVTKIDGRTIAYGNPGAWTGRIAEWYRSAVMG
ncbi:MAG: aminotransferase class IV [Betaproteobacteria bacterium]|nr:aminotransferase class IV [Betaproteobacteria bacterium]